MNNGKHVLHTENEAWCGKRLENYHWQFQSVDHLAFHGLEGNGLEIPVCDDCRNAIIEALQQVDTEQGEE